MACINDSCFKASYSSVALNSTVAQSMQTLCFPESVVNDFMAKKIEKLNLAALSL
jgi:hypothetical protein